MFKGLTFFLRCGWKYDKRYVIWNIMTQLLSSLTPILATLLPKLIIDELMGAQRIDRLILIVAAFAGYALFANALSSFFLHDGFSRRCRVDAQFGLEQHERLARADLVSLESPAYRDMKEKAMKFITCDWHGFGYLLDCALRIIGQSVTLTGIAAIMASINGWIILAFAALAVGSVWFEGVMRKRAMAMAQTVIGNQRKWMYFSSLFEDVEPAKEIRLNGIGKWLLRKEHAELSKINSTLRTQELLYTRADALTALATFIQQGVSYAYLIRQVLGKLITIGDFTMYTGAVTAFASSLRTVMNSLVEIRAYDTYYDQLDEFLNVPARLRSGKSLPVPAGEHRIELKNVGFKYPGADKWALRHVNLVLEPGEKLAVVGENGSGKTTLVKLICRLYDPAEGEILLDGMNIRDLDYEEYMHLFAAVFQDFRLFSFSLRENVAFGRDVPDDAISDALNRVGLKQFTGSLPHGLDTHIGRLFDEQGVEPSGGEGQRIALARALLKDAPVIILDEPTAALDPRAEYEIYKSFNALTEGRSAVYISHRLSSARFCDRIIVVDGGQIVENGTHDALITQNGKYAELFAMQAQFYVETEQSPT